MVTTKKAKTKSSKAKRSSAKSVSAEGKHLVIVESPTKARTINKYLGSDYVVMASVGHVRDLPARAPKGVKQEVPGVDLENDFAPKYEILPTKKKTVTELRGAAKKAADVWFATDLDREGEAIAWHLAHALGYPLDKAKRVVFNAITQKQIAEAFQHPRPIDENKVNAQQARRILDRIVGYQVSPLLWKKVAGGLSAGRVQSVSVRLVVEREREIEGFVPDEYWKITGYFTTDLDQVSGLSKAWRAWLSSAAERKPRTIRDKVAWLNDNQGLKAELIELAGKSFKPTSQKEALAAVESLGFIKDEVRTWEDPKAKGPAKNRVEIRGHIDAEVQESGRSSHPAFRIKSIQTKRTSTRPSAPFITSSMQQAAANVLGYSLNRTMRLAQQLYEGVNIGGGEGQVGLITYMRTDSTFVSGEALNMVRGYIGGRYGDKYLPEKPNFFSSKVRAAQEAHEAIRPTDVRITPERVEGRIDKDQFRLYRLIWERFVASQMKPAQWDATTVLIGAHGKAAEGSNGAGSGTRANAGSGAGETGVLKATGRTLVFDGFYKVTGLPKNGEEPILPPLEETQPVAPLQLDPTQHFTSPPPRYTEASLQKKLEEEGIGRPSTYAPIITTIQNRKYVERLNPKDRRLRATDLGKVVTDKLIEGFPEIMDLSYTREMELELDKIEEEDHDWVTMLRQFYGPFRKSLDRAHEEMVHAKAETEPAPHACAKCGAGTMYRFGRNGRFLSCATYPKCDYAAPIDAEGNPMEPEQTNVACPVCNSGMTRRTGRFGPFLGCVNYPECKGILNIDPKKGTIKLPKVPPFLTDLPCPKCDTPLNMRDSKRGLWLSCSKFPKCRGRLAWSAVPEEKQKELTAAWEKHVEANPVPVVRTIEGDSVGEDFVPVVLGEETEPEEVYAT